MTDYQTKRIAIVNAIFGDSPAIPQQFDPLNRDTDAFTVLGWLVGRKRWAEITITHNRLAVYDDYEIEADVPMIVFDAIGLRSAIVDAAWVVIRRESARC